MDRDIHLKGMWVNFFLLFYVWLCSTCFPVSYSLPSVLLLISLLPFLSLSPSTPSFFLLPLLLFPTFLSFFLLLVFLLPIATRVISEAGDVSGRAHVIFLALLSYKSRKTTWWYNILIKSTVKLFFNGTGKVATDILLGKSTHYVRLFGALQDH